MAKSKISESCVFIGLLALTSVTYALRNSVILSYSMPVGQRTIYLKTKTRYIDESYNGVIINNVYKHGTGILTDGKFGPVRTESLKGKRWVGWSSRFTKSKYISITFEFSGVRKFTTVTLTVNVKKTAHAVFNKLRVFFASTTNGFSKTSFLQLCPKVFPYRKEAYNAKITLSLCENTAKFIKMQLYFGGIHKWLLITEISFNSVLARGKQEKSLRKCSKDACIVMPSSAIPSKKIIPFTALSTPSAIPSKKIIPFTALSTPSPIPSKKIIPFTALSTPSAIPSHKIIPFTALSTPQRLGSTTLEAGNNSTGETSLDAPNDESTNSVAKFVGIGITLGIVLIVLVVILTIYKRRQAQAKLSTTVYIDTVEIQNQSIAETSQNDQGRGNDKRAADGGKESYDDVQILPAPSVYTKLDRNRQDETADDGTYEKLLKSHSDYVITPNDPEAESLYEEVR